MQEQWIQQNWLIPEFEDKFDHKILMVQILVKYLKDILYQLLLEIIDLEVMLMISSLFI